MTPDEHPWDSVDAFVDFVGRYRDQGIQDFILQPANADHNLIEQISNEVLPALR